MLSSYPGNGRIAFKYHVNCLAWVQLHPDRVKLKHGGPCICGFLRDLGLATATTRSLLHWFLLTLLFLRAEVIIHPEQLLDAPSFIRQLEAVIVDIQAGKEGQVLRGSESAPQDLFFWKCYRMSTKTLKKKPKNKQKQKNPTCSGSLGHKAT